MTESEQKRYSREEIEEWIDGYFDGDPAAIMLRQLLADNDRQAQLLAHVHLHLTNDEDFSVDELERDMRTLNQGKWIDTESLLIDARSALSSAQATIDELKKQLADAGKAFHGGQGTKPGERLIYIPFPNLKAAEDFRAWFNASRHSAPQDATPSSAPAAGAGERG
jgi:hypothetical protein